MGMTAREILGKYYSALSAKGGYIHLLSEDFSLTRPGSKGAEGKGALAEDIFFRYVKNLEVKALIVDGERACAVVDYILESPKGDRFSCAVAEIWEIKGKGLTSLKMYFDTVEYQKFMLPILFPTTRLKKLGRK
jgi:ketosteroid isomerase-like protein